MTAITLVPALATALAPFLPYLLKAGEKAAEAAISKFGEDAWDRARVLWARLLPAAKERPDLLRAAQNVVDAAPEEAEDALGALRLQLRRLLQDHPELADELQPGTERLHAQVLAVASGTRAAAVGVMHGGTVHTGDVIHGEPRRDGSGS